LNEIDYYEDNELNKVNPEMFRNHFSSDTPLDLVIFLYNKYLDYYNNNTHEEGKYSISSINDQLKNYLNNSCQFVNLENVKEFQNIIDIDKYFTFVKNYESVKTVIFLAEILTENSVRFPDDSLFWIKYALLMSLKYNDEKYVCRALTLASAYEIDVENNVCIYLC
jgi:hypothetical protein